jgi:hypothetical protein
MGAGCEDGWWMELVQGSGVNGVEFLGASSLEIRLKDGTIIYFCFAV